MANLWEYKGTVKIGKGTVHIQNDGDLAGRSIYYVYCYLEYLANYKNN